MAIDAQKKGKAGEVEFCKWLLTNLNIKTERNYNQANGSSADVIIEDFIFEVKRRETLDFKSWWHQVSVSKKSHENKNLIPIVAYRQNHKPWRFLLPANLIPGLELGYVMAEERVFLQFARNLI
jgi:hypothetical protein